MCYFALNISSFLRNIYITLCFWLVRDTALGRGSEKKSHILCLHGLPTKERDSLTKGKVFSQPLRTGAQTKLVRHVRAG